MTQRDLNRAIARATGEDIDTIAQMGFVEGSSGVPGRWSDEGGDERF